MNTIDIHTFQFESTSFRDTIVHNGFEHDPNGPLHVETCVCVFGSTIVLGQVTVCGCVVHVHVLVAVELEQE